MSGDAAALRAAALKAFMAGDLDGAERGFRAAAALAPADPEALRGLAMTLGRAGKHAEAVTWAERLAAAAPDDALALTTLSMALQKVGRIADAEAAQAKARTLGWKEQLKGKEKAG